jgi:hypothetical protein
LAADLNDRHLSQALVPRPSAQHPAIERAEPLTRVPQERLAHDVDEQAVEVRTPAEASLLLVVGVIRMRVTCREARDAVRV